MKSLIKSFMQPFVLLVALILIFEEWLWAQFTAFTRFLASIALFRMIEDQMRRLSPRWSLVLFLIPGAALIPFKIFAVELIAHGHPGQGVLIIVAAKFLGTALVAHVFRITRDKVLQIHWFFAIYNWVNRVMSWARAWVTQSRAYIKLRADLDKVKIWWRSINS